MKTAGNFLLITMNCILAAIATGLVTAVILGVVVLLMNGSTAIAKPENKQGSCGKGDTQCIVFLSQDSDK